MIKNGSIIGKTFFITLFQLRMEQKKINEAEMIEFKKTTEHQGHSYNRGREGSRPPAFLVIVKYFKVKVEYLTIASNVSTHYEFSEGTLLSLY